MKKLLFSIFMCLVATSSFAYIYSARQIDNNNFEFNDIEKSYFKYVYFMISNTFKEEQVKDNITMTINGEKVNLSSWYDKSFKYNMAYNLFTPVNEKGKQIKLKEKFNQVRITISDKVKYSAGKDVYYGVSAWTDSYWAGRADLIKFEDAFVIFFTDIEITD